MTNEEIINYGSMMPSVRTAAQCACDMKDKQFKGYLEKKRKKYTNGLSIALQKNAKQEAVVNDKIQCLLNEIINELFNED